MQSTMIALMNNAALLLVLSFAYQITYNVRARHTVSMSIFNGLFAAFLCIAIMSMPLTLAHGISYETRSILLSVTALIFGPIPTIISASIAVVFRILQGGAGTLAGIASIISSAVIGSMWRLFVHPKVKKKLQWLSVYVMSILVHAALVACMNLLPYPDRVNVIREIALPILIIFPLATVPLYLLLTVQEEFYLVRNQLEQSEERFRLLFDKAPLGYQLLDIDGNIVDVNQIWLIASGFSREDAIGKWFGDFIHPSYRDEFAETYSKIEETGQIHREYKMLNQGGEYQFVTVDGHIVNDSDGKFKQTLCILKDITKEKQAERDLMLGERKFRRLYETMAQGVVYQAVDGTVRSANPAAENILGFSPNTMIGMSSKDSNWKTIRENGSDFPASELPFTMALLTGKPSGSCLIGVYKPNSNDPIWITCSSIPIYEAEETAPSTIYTTFSDITARILTEKALRESEKRYSSYIENAPYAVFVVDEKGHFIEANPSASNITGYTREELLNMSMKDIVADESNDEAMHDSRLLHETGKVSSEIRYKHKDGSIRWWTIESVKISENRFLGYAFDITSKKQAESDLTFQSRRDYLTGLYNRRHYETEMIRLDTESQLPLSIIAGDIDGLKLINDTFGHAEGDKLIIESAEIIAGCCRPGDVVARTGGDEFGVILPKTDSDTADKIMKNIQTALREYDLEHNTSMRKHGVSLGYATKDKISEDIGNVFRATEERMYQRKMLRANSVHGSIVASIKAALVEKNHETEEHSERLVALCEAVGTVMKLSKAERDKLELLATLHDIGKVGISDNILSKPDRLTESEWNEMKRHPEIGYRIAMSSRDLVPIAEGILCHHEWWNGEGYPKGLSGENIPLLARIIAVVDAYDAMTYDRPYSKSIGRDMAIDTIRRNAGIQFDPQIAEIFINILTKDYQFI